MKVLRGILSESKEFYLDSKEKVEKKIAALPRGSIKERLIAGRRYYYLQNRISSKIIHKYLGKQKPDVLSRQIKERKALKDELKKIKAALKIIRRSQGKSRDRND